MNIKLVRSKKEDAKILRQIQIDAFYDDQLKYGWSPSSETLNEMIEKIDTFHYYSIFLNEKLIGGVCIIDFDGKNFCISRLFIHPDFQNKGIGQIIMQSIEDLFPHAKEWYLNTPKDNKRNIHFYQKCGYQLLYEEKYKNIMLVQMLKWNFF